MGVPKIMRSHLDIETLAPHNTMNESTSPGSDSDGVNNLASPSRRIATNTPRLENGTPACSCHGQPRGKTEVQSLTSPGTGPEKVQNNHRPSANRILRFHLGVRSDGDLPFEQYGSARTVPVEKLGLRAERQRRWFVSFAVQMGLQ